MSVWRWFKVSALAACMALCAPDVGLGQTENYADWSCFRTFYLFPGLNNPVTNFPLLVRLDSSNAADVFVGARSGGADLRFRRKALQGSELLTDHQLSYQIAYWDSAALKAEVWVLMDSLYPYDGANMGPYSQELYMYWGKPDAPARSNAAAVFDTANGYVGVWHMGGSSPSAARPNAVAGGNPAIPSGLSVSDGFPLYEGAIGLADQLRGGTDGAANASDDHFDLGSFTQEFSSGATLSMWILPSNRDTSAANAYMALGNGAPGDNLTLGRRSGTNDLFGEVYNGTKSGGSRVAGNVLNPDYWQYVAFSIKDSMQTIYWFQGYSSYGTRKATTTIPNVTRNLAYLGRSLWPDPNPAVAIDEARLSKVQRSLDWIRLEFTSQLPYPDYKPGTVQRVPGPMAPSLSAPASHATGVPAFTNLSWTSATDADKYKVQLSTDSLFTTLIVNTLVSVNSIDVGPLSGSTSYYWRVLSWNSGEGTSSWSTPRQFTVGYEPPTITAPILLSPDQFATNVSPTSTFLWKHASGATSYQFELSSTPVFSTLLRNDSGISALKREVGPLPFDSDLYWRVRGSNPQGKGPWSEIYGFTTAGPVALFPHATGSFSVSAVRRGNETVLQLSLARKEQVTVRWRDLQGRWSAPMRSEILPAGIHSLRFAGLPAGIHIMEVHVGSSTRRLLVGI